MIDQPRKQLVRCICCSVAEEATPHQEGQRFPDGSRWRSWVEQGGGGFPDGSPPVLIP